MIVPATWTGRTWIVAGIFSESDWMTKAGYVPGPQHDKYAPRWMINDCLRYSVHHPYAISERYATTPRGKHLGTFYGQGDLLRQAYTFDCVCDVFIERWSIRTNTFQHLVRTKIRHYLDALEREIPVEDLDTGSVHFC